MKTLYMIASLSTLAAILIAWFWPADIATSLALAVGALLYAAIVNGIAFLVQCFVWIAGALK